MFDHIINPEDVAEAASEADTKVAVKGPERHEQRYLIRNAFFARLEQICFQQPLPERRKLDALKDFCWREYHSAGYSEVLDYYVELSCLLRD